MSKTIYSKDHQQIVGRLKKARVDACLGQKQVAELLGITQSSISKIESGQRKIDIVLLKRMLSLYKKNISYFLKK